MEGGSRAALMLPAMSPRRFLQEEGDIAALLPWPLHTGPLPHPPDPLLLPTSQPGQMDAELAQLMRCLQHVHKDAGDGAAPEPPPTSPDRDAAVHGYHALPPEVIDQANEILSCISQPSVCSEVLLSPAGTAYIWGLAEVYRVSKRVQRGMKTRKGASELPQSSLHAVDLAWNNLQAFLSLCPAVLQRLLSEPSLGGEIEIHSPGPDLAPDKVCGICLTEVKGSPETLSGNSDPVFYQGSHYHASCANFWLNCVDSSLPREPVTLSSPS